MPDATLSDRLRVARWRWWLAAGGISLAAVALGPTVGWEDVRAALALLSREPLTLGLVAAAYTGAFLLRAAAWRLLVRSPVSLGSLFSSLQTGLLLNHLLPLKAGEVARPLVAAQHGVPAPEAISTTIVARVIDVVCLAAIAILAAPAIAGFGRMALVLECGVLAAGLGCLAFAVGRERLPLPLPAMLAARAAPAFAALGAVQRRRVLAAAGPALASWLLESAVLLGAAHLLGVDVPLRLALGATAFTILLQTFHVTPGGIGVYEAAMTSVLVSGGIGVETAASLAVLTHAMKFAYAFAAGTPFAAWEGVHALRRRADGPASPVASRVEVASARLWNVLNEGKPFSLVFSAGVILLLSLPRAGSPSYWAGAGLAVLALAPLATVLYHFDFPLRLRAALWAFLGILVVLSGRLDPVAMATVVALYLAFTVVLWGTVYYHMRIGTAWSNGFRFIRLVAENPDPTSGNLLEQVPKLLMLVLAFRWLVDDGPAGGDIAVLMALTAAIAATALLLHQWLFTWVPPVRQPRLAPVEPVAPVRSSRRFIAIVIDGCRADRLREARTPFIDEVRAAGTEYSAMDTVYPARTVTCFSSMLTGAPAAVHGMRSNFVPSLGVKCPSIFDSLRNAGMRGRLVGIAHLIDAFGEDDVRSVSAVMHNDQIDDALIARAKQVLEDEDPDLLVLQLLSVDQTGHARGSYNPEYLRKIEDSDGKLAAFFAWCGEHGYLDGATMLLTADHGQGIGIGGHGHMTPSEIRIPCVLWGEGVAAGRVEHEPRSIVDVAATIAARLGVVAPASSVGRPLAGGEPPGDDDRPVAFVVPAHNEEARLPGVLRAIAESGLTPRRVIVVDDGSSDGTAAVARAHGATVVAHERNRGLGAALRTGLAAARGLDPRATVYLDADGEYDGREAARLIAPIESGEADYVLGSRFLGAPEGMSRSRRAANWCFSGLLSVLCRRRISDGQTGYRAFSPGALDVAEIVHDYNYAQVLTLDLVRKRMRLREVAVSYRRRAGGRSFVRADYLWRVPLGMVREMLNP